MKTYNIHVFVFVFSCLTFSLNAQNFFYSYGKKVVLNKTDKVIIKTKATQTTSLATSQISSMSGLKAVTKISNALMYAKLSGQNIQSLNTNNRLPFNTYQVYTSPDGFELGTFDEFIVKLNEGYSKADLNVLIRKYNCSVINEKGAKYKLAVPEGADVLAISNHFMESGIFLFSHPDFIIEIVKNSYIPNDPYFDKQFSMHNTGQTFNDGHSGNADADVDAPLAWDITKGSDSIVVAVIDEGVTSNHPDLPNTRQERLNGSNFATTIDGTNANDPSPVGDGNHGNGCAGVIAATMDNNQGVTGIAPNVHIMPIRIPFGLVPASIYADAIDFAYLNGADVISNSWGYGSTNNIPDISDAIEDATTLGRGGLGSVVLFAAGNTANLASGNQGRVTFPSNSQVAGLITVGASDRYDQQANYSPTSVNGTSTNQIIDLVAPSHRAYRSQIAGETFEIWSMDIPGAGGYNSWPATGYGPAFGEFLPATGTNFNSYTGRFGGTSAATPLVAGIAALILSIDPSLAQIEVGDILTCSSDQVGGYDYSSGRSNELGYGRANAFNAVMKACPSNYTISWTSNEPEKVEYMANDLINMNSLVTANANLDVHAKNYVDLLIGFDAVAGSEVDIHIAGCSSCPSNTIPSLARESISYYDEERDNGLHNIQTDSELSFYPNPANEIVTVVTESNTIVKILSIKGNVLLHERSGEDGLIELNVNGLENGIYFIQSNDKTKRLIINK